MFISFRVIIPDTLSSVRWRTGAARVISEGGGGRSAGWKGWNYQGEGEGSIREGSGGGGGSRVE